MKKTEEKQKKNITLDQRLEMNEDRKKHHQRNIIERKGVASTCTVKIKKAPKRRAQKPYLFGYKRMN